MKNLFLSMSVVAALVFQVEAAEKSNCGLNTLKGTYTYVSLGTLDGVAPFSQAGMESYDGKGNIVNDYYDNAAGKMVRITGYYTMGPDCQGTAKYSSGEEVVFYVNPDGSNFVYSYVGNPLVNVAAEENRISKKLLLK